jgi:DNA-binding transcriptional LysR family regulator
MTTAEMLRREGRNLVPFPLPVTTADITISQVWHPRLDADPTHRWVRDRFRQVGQVYCLRHSQEWELTGVVS